MFNSSGRFFFCWDSMPLNSKEYIDFCYAYCRSFVKCFEGIKVTFNGYKTPIDVDVIEDQISNKILGCIRDEDLKYSVDSYGNIYSSSGFVSSWAVEVSTDLTMEIRFSLGSDEASNLRNSIFVEFVGSDNELIGMLGRNVWDDTISSMRPEKARFSCSALDKELNPDLEVDFNLGWVNYFNDKIDLGVFSEFIDFDLNKFSDGTEFSVRSGGASESTPDVVAKLARVQKYMVDKGYISHDDGF